MQSGERVYKHGGDKLADAVRLAYADGQTDYSMEPLVLTDESGAPVGKIKDGDAVVFCCRRGEREIELTDAFTEEDFPHFERRRLENLDFVILTMYHEKYINLPIAFAPSKVDLTLAECVSRAGLKQLHCSESEKFAHVTYFFNGGSNLVPAGEEDVRVPSPKDIPFDQVPELSLPKVADEVKKGIGSGYELIVVNFANGDVIGHTSNTEAKVKCAEYIDRYLSEVVEESKKHGYVTIITADHGNLETLYSEDGSPHVAHTTNRVPIVLVDPYAGYSETGEANGGSGALTLNNGKLADVSPTILHILNIPQPEAMTGNNLTGSYNFGDHRKVLLIILDGWGIGSDDDTNPIFIANTPYWDTLTTTFPKAELSAAEEAVGLQAGKAGNSEAGHINIGAGQVVTQDDVRLDNAMKDGSFEKNEVFLDTIGRAKERGAALHLLTLLTKKSSHGSIDYPLALLRMAASMGLADVYLHIIFDGRSTEPGSAPTLLEELDIMMEEIGTGQIVDGVGRGIALDRDSNYAKIEKAYNAFVLGDGRRYS